MNRDPIEIVLDCEKLANPLSGFAETLRQLRRTYAAVAPEHFLFRPMYPSKIRDVAPLPRERGFRLPRWRKDATVGWVVPFVDPFVRTPRRRVWHTTTQLAKYLPLERKTPLLLTVNDLSFLRVYDQAYARRKLAHVRKLVHRSARITAISAFVADDLRSHVEIGDRPLDVVHLGPSQFTNPQGPPPPYIDDRPILFTVGTIEPRKNLHVLLPMMAQLPPCFHLVIAGKGLTPYMTELRALAQEHGVADRVTLPGAISNDDRTWLYRTCTAFLFPTLAEGFGLPALDALHFGKPVFVSRNTSLPEIVGGAGFYWDDYENPASMATVFEEGMQAVSRDPAGHAAKARAQAGHFTWEKTARQYLKIYEELANGSASL